MLVRARANPRQSPRMQSPAPQRSLGEPVRGHTDRGGSHARVPARLGNTGAKVSAHWSRGKRSKKGKSSARPSARTAKTTSRSWVDRMSSQENGTETSIAYGGGKETFGKGAIVEVHNSQGGFYSNLFLVPKKDFGLRPMINLTALNCFVQTEHFKMADMHTPRAHDHVHLLQHV